MFRFDVIAGSIPLALIRLSPLAPPFSDHRFYLCLLICLVCLYVFVLLILSFMIMMRRLSLVGNKSLCSHVVKNTRIMILCYNMTTGTRADVETSGGLMTLDKKWYMQAQVHAAVSRICAVVQGTDSGQLGECLGLKAKVCQGPAAEGKFDKVEKLHGMCSDGVCREFLGAYVVDAVSDTRRVSILVLASFPE
jgi:hypothetical protein